MDREPDASSDGTTPDFTDETATFGDRLALAREAAGLDLAQLAHRLGVRPETLRNWEEDRAEPRANRLQMLAGMLDVSLVWLISGQGPGRGRSGRGRSTRPPRCVPRRSPQPARRAGAARRAARHRRARLRSRWHERREAPAIRLRRLRMRSARRGTREMDLILGGFAEAGLDGLPPAILDAFETFLSENDQDIYQWVSGQSNVPAAHEEIVGRIRAFIDRGRVAQALPKS